MKIKKVTIKNFRSYKNETTIFFDNLTAFVGRNDVGKSSVLEALDIFFNEGRETIKLDKDDINKENCENGNNNIVITVSFTDFPEKIIIDDTNETTLQNEYLLDSEGCLQIRKTFNAGNPKDIKISVTTVHPNNPECNDLLQKKQDELRQKISDLNIDCPCTYKNAEMRSAIWNHYRNDLQLEERDIDITTSIWEKLKFYLPSYSLFQSDRRNSASDEEIQDPLKVAVKNILADMDDDLRGIISRVQRGLQEVTDLTLEKLQEMNPEVAASLHPNISPANLRWYDVFKNISITGDNDIPINKRGSGVRRLVLISFFRASAEMREGNRNNSSIIYAIEEPETSQHAEHQKKLMEALINLSQQANTQIIITTHSGNIVKTLDFENVRIITSENGEKVIKNVEPRILPYKSLNAVNYLAFGDISESYHDELYGYLQTKALEDNPEYWCEDEFDKWLKSKGCQKAKHPWIKIKKGKNQACEYTLQIYIRNSIHHPENTLNSNYTKEELKASIEQMIEIVRNLNN